MPPCALAPVPTQITPSFSSKSRIVTVESLRAILANLDHQLQDIDFARVQQWIEPAAQERQHNFSCRMATVYYEPA